MFVSISGPHSFQRVWRVVLLWGVVVGLILMAAAVGRADTAVDRPAGVSLFSASLVDMPVDANADGDTNQGETVKYMATIFGDPVQDLANVVYSSAIDPNTVLVPNSVRSTPLAYSQAISTTLDTAVTITLMGSDADGETLTFDIVSPPSNGSLGTVTPLTATSAEVVYTPNSTFSGNDSFGFRVTDTSTFTDTAAVAISVGSGVGRQPVVAETAVNLAPSPEQTVGTLNNVALTIGTLPANKTVVIYYDVVINDPLPGNVTQISMQGSVLASGRATIFTDDPDTAEAGDATVTPVVQKYLNYLPTVLNNYSSLPDLVVSDLVAAGNAVTVTIANEGDTAVTDAFWVDVYLDPTTPPTAVNQTWEIMGTAGLVWGVDGGALPLEPGASLTLTINDAYYVAADSSFSGVIAAGTAVYAQVDSANENTTYGAVLENHEQIGGVYNNIVGPVVATP